MGIKVCPERNRHGEPPSFATLNQTCLKPTRPNRVTPSGTWYKFFNWCIEQDLVPASPATRVRALSSVTARERVLSSDELRWIWTALDGSPGVFGPLFKVLVLTGQRRGEVAGMRWDELRSLGTDDAIWDL